MGWIVLALIAGAIFFAISIYNRLVAGRNRFKNAFAQIDVQLTRRHDLIPNLVETAKGYMKHERETLEGVINARNTAVAGLKAASKDPSDPAAMKQLAQAEQGLSGALGRLFALSESYPDLKANQNFLDLQNQLEGTENRINVARQRYNQTVEAFNAKIRSMPYSLTNSLILHLDRKEYFKAEAGATQVPTIKFD